MTAKRSSMFLTSVTVIDHAYIDNLGRVIGGSHNPKFTISGEVDEVEQVVIDFSQVKKRVKALIDDCDMGYDHKLWLYPEWSGKDTGGYTCHRTGNQVRLETNALTMSVPESAIRVIHSGDYEFGCSPVGYDMEQYITHELRKDYPTIDVKVDITQEATALSHTPSSFFTYVHGLKDSSSWGCQNIAHGHLSYIQLLKEQHDGHMICATPDRNTRNLLDTICRQLDGTVFINRANVIGEQRERVTVGYTSRDRGYWEATYDTVNQKLRILETETTIEFLVDWVKDCYREQLVHSEATHLAVSEGLTKGALVSFR